MSLLGDQQVCAWG